MIVNEGLFKNSPLESGANVINELAGYSEIESVQEQCLRRMGRHSLVDVYQMQKKLKEENPRVEITLPNLLSCLAYVAYQLHPNHNPGGLPVLLRRVSYDFKNRESDIFERKNNSYKVTRYYNEIAPWLLNWLDNYPEIREWRNPIIIDDGDEFNRAFSFIDIYAFVSITAWMLYITSIFKMDDINLIV